MMLPLSFYGQVEVVDPLAMGRQEQPVHRDSVGNVGFAGFTDKSDVGRMSPFLLESEQYRSMRVDLRQFMVYPGIAPIASWNGGGAYAAGGVSVMPGMMAVNSGSLNIYQSLGNFSFSIYGNVNKYGYFRGLETSYGFGGSMSYQLADNVGVTLFGNYSMMTGIYQPTMAGYVSSSSFGGYFDFRLSERWGVKTGAQTYRSIVDNSWKTQPIVMPYVRLNGGQEIGVDVGGIVYGIFQSLGNHGGNHGNPTVPPPTMVDMH